MTTNSSSANSAQRFRIWLSPPEPVGTELRSVARAIESGWIAPLGPEVDAFEREFADLVGVRHAVALSSGTAALHLALIACGVGVGDEVAVSTFTFVASANPISYCGATPVFIDSEPDSWNMDPGLLEQALEERRGDRQVRAIVVVHLYGQTADMARIREIARTYGVPVIEDAAEALGATHEGRPAGSLGRCAAFSFNGNKIITTSGGGMLVTDDPVIAARARKLATQAREPVLHYEHRQLGYNYRLSNLLAAVGRAQLADLNRRVNRRREHFAAYKDAFEDCDGITVMPEASWGRHSRWLTCVTVNPKVISGGSARICDELARRGIESRPLWKPLHLQPLYAAAPCYNAGVAEELFRTGLCLPSGSGMTDQQRDEVINVIRSCVHGARSPMV